MATTSRIPSRATAIYEGERVRVLLLDPPFAYGRQAVIEYDDGEQERVSVSKLIGLERIGKHVTSRAGRAIIDIDYNGR